MKRRDFLRVSALSAGTVAAVAPLVSSCSRHEPDPFSPEYLTSVAERVLLDTLENKFLKVLIYSNAQTEITDKVNNVTWHTLPVALQDDGPIDQGYVWQRVERDFCEQYPSTFAGKKSGSIYQFTVLGRQNRIKGAFTCSIELENDWLRYRILTVSNELPSLVFPPPVDHDAMIIPYHIGKLISHKQPQLFFRRFYRFFSQLNMRMIGGQKGENCWIGIYEEGFEDGGAFAANNLVAPAWLRTLGRWSHPYSIKFKFDKGNYVRVAKIYRQWAIEQGLFKSLEQKITENPALKNYIGGRTLTYFEAFPPRQTTDMDQQWFTSSQIEQLPTSKVQVDFTHAEVKKSVAYAHQKGFTKGLMLVRGWINKGYDASHPDIWPPEPSLGSIDELKDLLKNSDSPQVVSALHDNYQDMYEGWPSFPKGVNVNPRGDLQTGGFWAPGQTYILSSKASVQYAQRNWEQVKQLNPKAMYIDTITASHLNESYDPKKPQTKTDDHKGKLALMRFFKDQKIILGSEEGADFGIPYLDWMECRHTRSGEGQSIPLWPLVFHDAVVMNRLNSFDPDSPYPKWLEDMLWGYQLHFFMSPAFGNPAKQGYAERVGFGANEMTEELFVSTFDVDRWHEKIGLAEMTSHRFVTDDSMVEETTFANGHSIMVNFSSEDRMVEGHNIKAHGYVIV